MSNDLKHYFEEYGASAFDPDKTEEFYGDFAVASAPGFVGVLKGHEEMNRAFSEIAGHQKRTGLKSMKPSHVEETKIDDLHTWAKVTWNALFEKTGDKVISFDVSYLIRREKDTSHLLLSISHQDEQKMRQELGIA